MQPGDAQPFGKRRNLLCLVSPFAPYGPFCPVVKASRELLLSYSLLISFWFLAYLKKKQTVISSWDLRLLFIKADSRGRERAHKVMTCARSRFTCALTLTSTFLLFMRHSGAFNITNEKVWPLPRLLGGKCQVPGMLHRIGMSCLPGDLNHTNMIWSQDSEPVGASLPTRRVFKEDSGTYVQSPSRTSDTEAHTLALGNHVSGMLWCFPRPYTMHFWADFNLCPWPVVNKLDPLSISTEPEVV